MLADGEATVVGATGARDNHHQSNPENIETNGNVSNRAASVVEYPTVDGTEPL